MLRIVRRRGDGHRCRDLSATRSGHGFAVEQRMPLARYFLYVGGVLLALLFIVGAYLPKFPVAAKATANSPVIFPIGNGRNALFTIPVFRRSFRRRSRARRL